MIVVCTNYELLGDGTYLSFMGQKVDLSAIMKEISKFETEQEVEVDCDSFFAHWSGGRYDQFFRRNKFVAYSHEADSELAEKLNDLVQQEIERQDRQEQFDDCKYFAARFEGDRDDYDLDWFISHPMQVLLPNCNSTDLKEIITALRERIAEGR